MESTKERNRKRNIREIASGEPVAVAKVSAGGDPELVSLALMANKIYSAILYSDEVRKDYGPVVVRRAIGKDSLRSIARATGLSSAYLSLVVRGEVIISPASFMLLVRFVAGKESARA